MNSFPKVCLDQPKSCKAVDEPLSRIIKSKIVACRRSISFFLAINSVPVPDALENFMLNQKALTIYKIIYTAVDEKPEIARKCLK